MTHFNTELSELDDSELIVMHLDTPGWPLEVGEYAPIYDAATGDLLGRIIVTEKDDEKLTMITDPLPNE